MRSIGVWGLLWLQYEYVDIVVWVGLGWVTGVCGESLRFELKCPLVSGRRVAVKRKRASTPFIVRYRWGVGDVKSKFGWIGSVMSFDVMSCPILMMMMMLLVFNGAGTCHKRQG